MTEVMTLDESEVHAPNIPIAVALQEASDLSVLLSDNEVASTMATIGVHAEQIERLAQLIEVCRDAQSQWMIARDRSKDQAQKEREAAGADMRTELIAACRWNLRENNTAQATLSAIASGAGVADLVQDLADLGELILKHAASFAMDSTLDPTKTAETAHSTAAALADGLSGERYDQTQRKAKALRDRTYTLLADEVTDLRGAGRYAFRNTPKMLRNFGSQHRRRLQRRGTNTPVVVLPVQPAE